MDLKLTLDMIYDLPTKILSISEENDGFVDMISERTCNQYNIEEIKFKLTRMFKKFNGVKFYYYISPEEAINNTSKYGNLIGGSSQRDFTSKQDKEITNRIDSMICASEFYDCIISLSRGLNIKEATFLSYGLMGQKTNEYMAEILNISVRSMQPIKKSCMVKAWSALKTLYEEDTK